MAESPCGHPEYGAAKYPLIDASFSNLNFISSSSASQLHLAESSSDDLDAVWSRLNISSQEQLGHGDFNLGAFPEFVISPPQAHEIILSNGAGTSTNRPSAQAAMEPASATCNLQPQKCERSPSLTFSVDALEEYVAQLDQCLPALAENMANIEPPHDPSCNTRSRHILHQYSADFSFYLNPISNPEPAEKLCTAVSNYRSTQASASDMPLGSDMFSASAMDIHNHQNADAARFSVDKIPKLVEQGGPSQYFQALGYPYTNHSCPENFAESPMSYVKNMESMGAFSDSVAMGFSTASSPSTTSLTYRTSMAGFVGVSFSAPVSLTPSVEKGALNESFHSLEDIGCVPGGIQVSEELRNTQLVIKLRDKFARGKHHAQGGIKKRRNYSRRTSPPAIDAHSLSENATRRTTDPEDMTNDEDNRVILRLKMEELTLDDGYVWRKYGKKSIKGEKFSRNYLRCEESKRSGCTVVKHTQRCTDDEDYVQFLYIGRHNHPVRS